MPPEIPAWNMPPGGKRSSGMTEACMLGGTATIIEKRPVVQRRTAIRKHSDWPTDRESRMLKDGASFRHRRARDRSEEHTSELQSLRHLVCRLLLEKKKKKPPPTTTPTRLR